MSGGPLGGPGSRLPAHEALEDLSGALEDGEFFRGGLPQVCREIGVSLTTSALQESLALAGDTDPGDPAVSRVYDPLDQAGFGQCANRPGHRRWRDLLGRSEIAQR